MIHTIREAFNDLLAENDWMDDETRAVAKEKADAMNERIGYPQLITESRELIKEYQAVREFCWEKLKIEIVCEHLLYVAPFFFLVKYY